MSDVLGELGKFVLFLLGMYYGWMASFHSWISVSVGVPAAFLVTALVFVFLPCIVFYVLVSLAVSSTYSVLEFSWSLLLKVFFVTIVVFMILYAFK